MSDPVVWGAIAAAASVVLGAITYTVTRILESRASVVERRREAVARVLVATEVSARNLGRLWPSRNSELEFALLIPHLVAELPKKDEQVAIWVARRTQDMSRATSDRAASSIALDVSIRLAGWRSGRTKLSWFGKQNEDSPLLNDSVSRSVKMARYLSAARRPFVASLLVVGGLFSVVEIIRYTWAADDPKKPSR